MRVTLTPTAPVVERTARRASVTKADVDNAFIQRLRCLAIGDISPDLVEGGFAGMKRMQITVNAGEPLSSVLLS
jgi:hypothetical protein